MPGKKKGSFIPLIIDPTLLPRLFPDLLADRDREITQRRRERFPEKYDEGGARLAQPE